MSFPQPGDWVRYSDQWSATQPAPIRTPAGREPEPPGATDRDTSLEEDPVYDSDVQGFVEIDDTHTSLLFGDLVGEEGDWQEQALCAQTDPEAFFPEKGGSTREAKRICSGCEVRSECLEYALEHDERFGIWGGLSERERRRLRRRAC